MEEDLAIIETQTRNEKIKSFFLRNKKKLIISLFIFIISLIGYFGFKEFKKNQKIELSNFFNSIVIEYSINNKETTTNKLIDIVKKKDPTYSPLSLYFIIDNDLILDKEKVNDLFNILIDKTPLEKEIKNLIIYKKALFNSDTSEENVLINTLKPLINSESIWKSHALYLLGEYFYSKNEKEKSKEFLRQIIKIENANLDIRKKAQKRLSRDFFE